MIRGIGVITAGGKAALPIPGLTWFMNKAGYDFFVTDRIEAAW